MQVLFQVSSDVVSYIKQRHNVAGDSVDVEELRSALSVIRQRRHAAAMKERPDFLENVDPKGELGVLYDSI